MLLILATILIVNPIVGVIVAILGLALIIAVARYFIERSYEICINYPDDGIELKLCDVFWKIAT